MNVSDSANPKFDIVTGNSKSAEANAGITPAVLIFKGKWEDSLHTFYFLLVFLDSWLKFFIALSKT